MQGYGSSAILQDSLVNANSIEIVASVWWPSIVLLPAKFVSSNSYAALLRRGCCVLIIFALRSTFRGRYWKPYFLMGGGHGTTDGSVDLELMTNGRRFDQNFMNSSA